MSKALLVGPFPNFVNEEKRDTFLRHFGSIKTFTSTERNKHSYSIGIFNSEEDCKNALYRLHQQEIFGKRINARYYEVINVLSHELPKKRKKEETTKITSETKFTLQKYESEICGISSPFNITYPINPKLRYRYPPPSSKIISNIGLSLLTVPKFYNQVLHLMNKMNLPPPFGEKFAQSPLFADAECQTVESESESEYESDEETLIPKNTFHMPIKRKRGKTALTRKKPNIDQLKQSLVKIVKPVDAPKTGPTIQEIFDQNDAIQSNRSLKVVLGSTGLPSSSNVLSSNQDDIQGDGFGKLYPMVPEDSSVNKLLNPESKESSKYISMKELEENRILETEWPLLPVFKNYSPGDPSEKLYIKNLSKTVTEADLNRVFGRFVDWSVAEEASKFSIRHMKEGRMKGQAFVTYSTSKAAAEALKAVNGFILKDKAIVIVYGKVKATQS